MTKSKKEVIMDFKKQIENFDEESVKVITIEVYECWCNRCKSRWISLSDTLPATCANPDCRSPYWNRMRVKDLKEDRIMKPKRGKEKV